MDESGAPDSVTAHFDVRFVVCARCAVLVHSPLTPGSLEQDLKPILFVVTLCFATDRVVKPFGRCDSSWVFLQRSYESAGACQRILSVFDAASPFISLFNILASSPCLGFSEGYARRRLWLVCCGGLRKTTVWVSHWRKYTTRPFVDFVYFTVRYFLFDKIQVCRTRRVGCMYT